MRTREKTIFRIIILSIAFLIFINIWPLGNIKQHSRSEAKGEIANYQLQTTNDKIITHVIFTHNHLGSITQKIELEQWNDVDSITFRLLDTNFKPVFVKDVRVEQILRDKQVKLEIDMDVTPGENYFYEWLVPEVYEGKNPIIVKIPLEYKEILSQPENQALYINDAGTIEYALVADYDYSRNYSWIAIIGFGILIFGTAIGICKLVDLIDDKTIFFEKLYENGDLLNKITIVIISALALLVFVLSVFVNIWGGNPDDRVVYAIGIITLWGWGVFALKSSKNKKENEDAAQIVRNYLQIVCFAMAIYSACRYVNADRELVHIVNTRRIVCYLLGAFVLMIDRHNRPVLKLWKNVNVPGLIIWIAFILIMIINKAELTWPPVILCFGIPFLFKMNKEGQQRLLNNFAWGVYVSFFITSLYSLAFRPHNTWIYYRYPGMFHTVAYTGMYLCIVAAVSLARVFVKNEKIDYFIFTCSVGYILMSMTRAAMLSVAVAFVIVFLLVAITNGNFTQLIKKTVIIGGLSIAGFCMTFSATRMIPAVVNQPRYLMIENTESFGVCKGERIDSIRYLRFNRYVSIMFGRFGRALYGEEEAKNEAASLLVSADHDYMPLLTSESQIEGSNLSEDISNGRIEVFKAYLSNIGIKPHEEFSLIYEGKEYAHAHNAFLQISYLFGIIDGILFIIICVITFISAIIYYLKNRTDINSLVPLLITVVFGITSAIEWTYQPGIPIGFAFMFIQMFLIKRAVEANTNK